MTSVRQTRNWMSHLLALPARGLRADARRAAKLVLEAAWSHKRLMAAVFCLNLGAAVFESSTMATFVVALETLVGRSADNLAASYGAIGAAADDIRHAVGKDGLFLLLVALAVASQLLRSGLQFAGIAASAHLQIRAQGEVQSRVIRQIMAMSYAHVNRYQVGDLKSYVDQTVAVSALINRLNTMLSTLLLMVAYAGVLLWLSWPTTLVTLVALALFSSSMDYVVRRVRRIAQQFMTASVELSKRTVELLQAPRLLRAFAREDFAAQRIESELLKSIELRRRGTIWQGSIAPLMEAVTAAGVAIFLVAAYVALGEGLPSALPRILTFLYVLYRLMPLVGSLTTAWANVNDLLPSVERAATILRTEDKQFTRVGGQPFQGLRQGIELRNVSLRYVQSEHPALVDVSFTLPRGEMVALVGGSGAGKSTLADLLLGLYDPTAGQILVDGVDLHDLDLRQWRAHIGVVSQGEFLFHASIRDNIAFGKLDASREEIVAAARMANAHDFIEQLADGYDTVIGERGYRLSGGQRQRLALARAIVRRPSLLILDEATSELDSQSEHLIQQALEQLRQSCTVLAIAHRLSTIVGADAILVLEQGRVVERGSHAELLARDGVYARFWRLQAQEQAKGGRGRQGVAMDVTSA